MLCIDNTYTDVYFNLAMEEYLLKNFEEDIFMIWQNEPSIILGKHQNIWAEANIELAKKKDIKIIRRYTGGGTVYHDLGNLNLSFIENNKVLDFDKYTHLMISILSEFGIKAEANARRALTINGLKISGSAQSVHKNRLLYHATLLYSSDLDFLINTLDSSNNEKKEITNKSKTFVSSVKSPVTNILDHLTNKMSIKEFKYKVLDYFLNQKENSLYELNKKDILEITKLRDNKYKREDWTYNSL